MNNLKSFLSNFNSKRIFVLLSVVTLLVMIWLHNDYCLTNDEPIHQLHGKVLLDYYKGANNSAVLSPLDSAGNIIATFSVIEDNNFRGMNFFGGFFDLTVNYLHSYFPETDLYNFRHLINSFFGFILFLFIGLTAKELGGWKTAVIAFLFAVLSPRLFGHAFVNPKDIPFAAIYIVGIHQIIVFLKNLPKVKILNSIFLALIFAISIDIRVSGLLLIVYFLLSVVTYWIIDYYRSRYLKIKETSKTLGIAIAISLVGYWAVRFLWPYAATDFFAPFKVLLKVSSFSIFNAYEVFQGNWYNAWEIPYSYIPTWIWISSPIFINLGILLTITAYHPKLKGDLNLFIYSLLLFVTLFPILFILAKHSNIYNGIRHLLFVFPTLIVLAAVAWEKLIDFLKQTQFYFITILILAASMLQPAIWSIKNHPYEAMYFSPLVGGNLAIFGKYETDYWGISTKEAVEWIANHTIEERKQKVVKIKMFYGDEMKVTNYSKNFSNLEYIPGNDEKGFDYEIIYSASAKFNKNLINTWPPENTVYEVKAGGIPLCAIVESKFKGLNTKELAEKYPTEANYMALCLEYYNAGDFINSILSAKKILAINSNNYYALNNIGAAANSLGLYDYAYINLTKALALNSDFELAKNNIAVSVKNIDAFSNNHDWLLRNSLNAYYIGEFEYVVRYSQRLIKLSPKDAIAYNNLCSAYNALEQYDKGEKACLKALQIDKDFQLAKNNLAYSRDKMAKAAGK